MNKITGKVNYKEVLKGDTGYTFEPHVTVDGVLYWTNNGNLENPLPVNLHGKQGFMFIPHVDSEGNLSWTNTGELENPPTVNIKGDKGYFYTPHISEDGILTWSNNGNLENPQPFNISDLILNEVKESRVDTTGKTFSKLKERLDSDFKKLSESIKNNDTKDEVVQARTATTGENFMTLDDRIDHEVMRLREKIEVTMLEQEDKESHDISNTVEGLTTDMVIKGRTLQNLLKDKIDFVSSSSSPHTGQKKLVYATNPNKPFTIIADIKYTGSSLTQLFVRGNKTDSTFVEFGSIIVPSNFNGRIACMCNQNIDKGCSSVLIGFRANSDNTTIKNVIILEGDWSNKLFPQYFEGIKSFGQQEDKISILSTGKNLADNSIFDINNYDNSLYRIYNKKFKPNANYTCKSYLKKEFNKEKIRIWMRINEQNIISNSESYPRVTTTVGNNGMLKIDFYCEGISKDQEALTFIKEHFNIQLEEGTQATSYQPYKEDKKDILLSSLGFDEGLRGINSISDEINYIRKVAIERIGKREYREGDLLLDNVITDKVNTYYVLEEPIETPLDENINLKTFGERTYVSFENSISGTSSFKAPVNTNKLINDLKFEKEDLKEKFNNLTTEFENFKTYMIQTLPYKEV